MNSFLSIIWLAAWLTSACTETDDWKTYTDAGQQKVQEQQYVDAEPLLLAALAEAERLGLQDPRLATSLHNLGELYRLQTKYTQAEPFYWRALPIWAGTVGANHPEMATSLTGLALLYQAQDQYERGEPLLKRALAIRENAYGRDHLEVAHSLEQYAALLRHTNRHEEAEAMQSRAHAILTRHSTSTKSGN